MAPKRFKIKGKKRIQLRKNIRAGTIANAMWPALKKKYVSQSGSLGAFDRFNSRHPFPINWRTKFVYTETVALSTLNLSVACGTTIYMGLNALYDTYLAAGGHQPYGFDQLISSAGPYYRYKVHGVKIDATFFDPNTDSGITFCMAVHNPLDYSAGSTISALTLDKINEKHNTYTAYVSNTGSQLKTVSKYFSMNQLFNVTKSQFANDLDTSTGGYNGNPSSTPALEIGVLDIRGGASSTMLLKLNLTFYTQCYDRAQLTQS